MSSQEAGSSSSARTFNTARLGIGVATAVGAAAVGMAGAPPPVALATSGVKTFCTVSQWPASTACDFYPTWGPFHHVTTLVGRSTHSVHMVCVDAYLDPAGSPYYTAPARCHVGTTSFNVGSVWGYGRVWWSWPYPGGIAGEWWGHFG
jgi:hypothetical protein